MTDPAKLSSATARIEAIAMAYGNADARPMEMAAANVANNCPAFWHRASGSNDVMGVFIGYLNEAQDVRRAWDMFATEFPAAANRVRNEAILDKLLPLNLAAAASLAEAYDEISTFRLTSELMARTYRADEAALAALADLKARDVHPLFGIDHGRIAASEEAIREANTERLREQLSGSVELAGAA